MHDSNPGTPPTPDTAGDSPETELADEAPAEAEAIAGNSFTELRDDLSALVEDARTYAEAEIAFQKTRAGLAGKAAGRALGLLVLALVLLHIALIALAVGAVIALAPLVSIWGAIAIVVGVMLAGVGALVYLAVGDGKVLSAMFASGGTK
jgi:hypothetical protein